MIPANCTLLHFFVNSYKTFSIILIFLQFAKQITILKIVFGKKLVFCGLLKSVT